MKAKINYSLISNESRTFQSRFIEINNNHLRSGDVLVVNDNGKIRFANFICYCNLGSVSNKLKFIQVASMDDIKEYKSVIMDNSIKNR